LVSESRRAELPTKFSNWSAKLSAERSEFVIEKSRVVESLPQPKVPDALTIVVVVPSGNSGKFFLSTSISSLIAVFLNTPSGMTVAGSLSEPAR
jgi:hypothetical protein